MFYRSKLELTFRMAVYFLIGLAVSGFSNMVFAFHGSNGRVLSSSEFSNKWIIVNYWADWCDSCMEEIPELNKFYKNNQGKNMIIVGVNYDRLENPGLQQAIQRAGILFPVLQEDPASKWRLSEVTVLPTTFIINPDGDVVRKIIGPNTEQSLLKIVHNRLYGKKNIKEKKNQLA